jgi:hypothetical protein
LHSFRELVRPRTFGGPHVAIYQCAHAIVSDEVVSIWAFLLVWLLGDRCLISVPVHLCRLRRWMTETAAVNEQPRILSGHASRDVHVADRVIFSSGGDVRPSNSGPRAVQSTAGMDPAEWK